MNTIPNSTGSSYLSSLIVGGVEAFDDDLSEDVGLEWLLCQVTVVNNGWMQEEGKTSSSTT